MAGQHCTATPTNTLTQVWQSVCLPYLTTKTTEKLTDTEEHLTENAWFTNLVIPFSAETIADKK